ncbi:MAG: hypothetical protein AAF604_03900 [Acidobacteriota bacterium]
MMKKSIPPKSVIFDSTPEIYATDPRGAFFFPLVLDGEERFDTSLYDEVRFVISLWHPSGSRSIDLDRAYVELQANFAAVDPHWTKIAEIEPVVPAYNGGETFDGWIVLPVLGADSAFAVVGSGFDPRARLQIRASAYMVA